MYSWLAALVFLAGGPLEGGPSATTVAAANPATVVAAARRDALTVPEGDRPYQRYLRVAVEEKERQTFLRVLRLHLNLLSDQGAPASFTLVRSDLLRLDVRDLGWDKRLEVWEKLAQVDPYFHARYELLEDRDVVVYWPGGKDQGKDYPRGVYAQKRKTGDRVAAPAPWANPPDSAGGKGEHDLLRQLLSTEAPVLDAQWFFVQTARQVDLRNQETGAGYYDFLGIADRKAFFALIGLDEKVAIDRYREWRAVVARSKISQQNRQIVALQGATGRAWGTLDTFVEAGRGIAQKNLRRGEFAHDAEEWYGVLPNGLFVTFLSDKDGVRQASAPDKIGPDDSTLNTSRDGRVHANLSCLRCHGVDRNFLKPLDDWARKTFRAGGPFQLADPDKKVTRELESQYLRDVDRILERDREDYVDAVRKVTATPLEPLGWSAPATAKAYAGAWDAYAQKDVSLDDATRELGASRETFLVNLRKFAARRGLADLVLSAFLEDPPRPVRRLHWENEYALAQTIVLGITLPERLQEVKKP